MVVAGVCVKTLGRQGGSPPWSWGGTDRTEDVSQTWSLEAELVLTR